MKETIYWEGKCQKVHFVREDIGNILMGTAILAIMYYWKYIGIESHYFIITIFGIICGYMLFGNFLIRLYYVRNVRYQITDEKIVIIMKIFRWEYKRCYLLKNIETVSRRTYKDGIGSIHFGEAENKMWERNKGYTDKREPLLTGGGMLRRDNKYHSGIIYSISNVEAVYRLLLELLEDERLL